MLLDYCDHGLRLCCYLEAVAILSRVVYRGRAVYAFLSSYTSGHVVNLSSAIPANISWFGTCCRGLVQRLALTIGLGFAVI